MHDDKKGRKLSSASTNLLEGKKKKKKINLNLSN